MSHNSGKPPSSLPAGSGGDNRAVDAFLDKIARTPAVAPAGSRGRMVFALDATLSRQPTWDLALSLQSRMFETAAASGGLDVQLVYFRGLGECRASRFVTNGGGLAALMQKIDCRGGHTQIGKVLKHVLGETQEKKVAALVYVGDAMEENADALAVTAGELGLRGLKAFMFHEGHDPVAGAAFREIARLTGGRLRVVRRVISQTVGRSAGGGGCLCRRWTCCP